MVGAADTRAAEETRWLRNSKGRSDKLSACGLLTNCGQTCMVVTVAVLFVKSVRP